MIKPYIKDFKYDNRFASSYNLIIANIGNTSNGATTVATNSQLNYNNVKAVGSDAFLALGANYADPYTCTIYVCHTDVFKKEPVPLTELEISTIKRWLIRRDGAHKLKIMKTGYENLYFLGNFNVSSINVGGETYGFELTFTSTYPYAFIDEKTVSFTNVNSFMIYNKSDEYTEIYPYCQITCLADGDLRISNTLDNQVFEITGCKTNEIITIDNQTKQVTSSIRDKVAIANAFNYNFIKINNTYQECRNVYTSSLNITTTIKFSPIQKVGV